MTVQDADIEQQLRLGEDSRWEFKQIEFSASRAASPTREDLADEMIAFANASGGTLLCGVADDGRILGMSREQMVALDHLLVEVSTDSIEPALRIDVQHRQLKGKAFLLVVVPQGDALHERGGRSFIRVGASKRRLVADECMRLAQRRAQGRYLWFDRQFVANTGFETLSERFMGTAAQRGRSSRPSPRTSESATIDARRRGRAPRHRRGRAAVRQDSPGVPARCRHHGDALSRQGPRVWATGFAGDPRSAPRSSRRCS